MMENQGNEVSLKDVLLKIKELFYECLRLWWVLAIFVGLFSVYFIYNHVNHESTYKANLQFLVQGSGSGGGGQLGGLLGQFGINRGGGNNPHKVLTVSKSNKMTKKIFKERIDSILVPNYIIKEYEFDKEWKESESDYANYLFSDIDEDLKDIDGRSIFSSLKSKLWGRNRDGENALLQLSFDDETRVYTVTGKTKTEDLSVTLVYSLFNNLKYFFEQEVFEQQSSTLAVLNAKVDSIKALRDSKIYTLANYRDRNSNLINATSSVNRALLETDIQALSIAYADLIKNKEFADFNLRDSKPFFISIDEPMTPIRPSSSSLLISLIKAGIFGVFFGIIFIVVRKVLKDALDD